MRSVNAVQGLFSAAERHSILAGSASKHETIKALSRDVIFLDFMEDWVRTKDRIIEELFALTYRLSDEVKRQEWDAMDLTLQERAKVFVDLIRLDRAHAQEVTEKDALWAKQLEAIKKIGDQTYATIREELVKLANEFRAGEESRRQIFESEMISPKGSKIEKRV